MKKILLVGTYYLYYMDSYIDGLKKTMEVDIDVIYIYPFNKNNLSLFNYLKYKLNKRKYKEKYRLQYVERIVNKIKNNYYDAFYSLSGNIDQEYVDQRLLQLMKEKNIMTTAVYRDSIRRFREDQQNIEMYDRVFTMEPSDIEYMKCRNVNNIYYMPVGASDSIYCSNKFNKYKEYDICFVGGYDQYRIAICEQIAKYCLSNGIKFVVYGYYWKNKKHEYKFIKKYPNLHKCIINQMLSGEDVAALYKKSRICLNIHIPIHLGLNARVFEISGSPNFQLCDDREDFSKLGFIDGENIAVYKDAEDCIKKIKYYLAQDELREKIATKGNELVLSRYTMNRLMFKTLDSEYKGEL